MPSSRYATEVQKRLQLGGEHGGRGRRARARPRGRRAARVGRCICGALAGRPVLVSGGGGSGAAGDRGLSPGPRRGLPAGAATRPAAACRGRRSPAGRAVRALAGVPPRQRGGAGAGRRLARPGQPAPGARAAGLRRARPAAAPARDPAHRDRRPRGRAGAVGAGGRDRQGRWRRRPGRAGAAGPGPRPGAVRQGQRGHGRVRRGHGGGGRRRALPAGGRHGLLLDAGGLPGDPGVAACPRVDRGADGLVRQAAGHGHLHRPVPGPSRRDPAPARGLAGGGRGGQAGG